MFAVSKSIMNILHRVTYEIYVTLNRIMIFQISPNHAWFVQLDKNLTYFGKSVILTHILVIRRSLMAQNNHLQDAQFPPSCPQTQRRVSRIPIIGYDCNI